MKKIIYVIILIVAVTISFFAGMAVGKGGRNKSVVGVYETDSWNGKTGTLVLYEDGSCQYPSGGKATWELDGDVVRITRQSSYQILDGRIKSIDVLISIELSQERTDEILTIIERIQTVSRVSWDSQKNICTIELKEAESGNTTTNELAKIEGVTILATRVEEKEETKIYEAKVMENGLVLYEKFFEKVSN